MRRWHFSHSSPAACLSLPWGHCRGVFFICGDVSEEEAHDFSSLCPITIKIWRFSGWKRKCQNKKHLSREGRRDGRCFIWTFCPIISSRLENVLLPSHSALHLTVVDFSPASPPPPTVTGFARVRFLASTERNPLAMSLDPRGVSERGRNCSWVRGYI